MAGELNRGNVDGGLEFDQARMAAAERLAASHTATAEFIRGVLSAQNQSTTIQLRPEAPANIDHFFDAQLATCARALVNRF